MENTVFTWGQLKEDMEEIGTPDDAEIWVEIREFTNPRDDIPKSAMCGSVQAITKLSDSRIIFTHDR